MSKVLVVIDIQNDFVTGALGSKEAQAIVPNVRAKSKSMQIEVIGLFLPEILIGKIIWKRQKERNYQ